MRKIRYLLFIISISTMLFAWSACQDPDEGDSTSESTTGILSANTTAPVETTEPVETTPETTSAELFYENMPVTELDAIVTEYGYETQMGHVDNYVIISEDSFIAYDIEESVDSRRIVCNIRRYDAVVPTTSGFESLRADTPIDEMYAIVGCPNVPPVTSTVSVMYHDTEDTKWGLWPTYHQTTGVLVVGTLKMYDKEVEDWVTVVELE